MQYHQFIQNGFKYVFPFDKNHFFSLAQLARSEEYTNFNSAEEKDPFPHKCPA